MTFLKRLAAPVAAVLLCLAPITAAQTADYPDTQAGRQLEKFITAFNTGSEDVWNSWILQSPLAADSANVLQRRLGFFRRLYNDLGKVEVYSVDPGSEFNISCLVQGTSPSGPYDWIRVGLRFDTLPPYDLAGMSARPADDPNEKLPEGELTPEKLGAYLDGVLDEMVTKDRFSGAVLVAKDGVPVYKRAAGMACKSYDVPNKTDTKFNLGSMNKMFTGVAIAQLAQQGKLSFDDPIIKHLPDYPNKEVAEKVTIHHLLTHTSGLGDYWEELFDARWWQIRSVQQLADLFWEKPLDFEPGDHFQYSNGGPIILGLIIEKITALSYDEYIRQNVTGPAGMVNTDCYEVDRPIPNLALGYTKMGIAGEGPGKEWRSNLFLHAAKGGPAGGGFSTVEDLLKFDIALRGHKLLDEEYTDIVTTGKVDTGPGNKYAYLFGDENVNGHRVVGHNGGAPGINAVLAMYLDLGYTVAVLANYDGAAEVVAGKIKRALTR
ncbi:MAG: serine hydrolase domain-containing protein [Candidatus Zixiibacteriota bacterium]